MELTALPIFNKTLIIYVDLFQDLDEENPDESGIAFSGEKSADESILDKE